MMIVALATVILSGCSTYAVDRYAISADSVMALRAYQEKMINVDEFTSTEPGLSQIPCRAVGPIKTPDGETFAQFIREALVDELRIAEAFSPNAPITLTGNLNDINFSSATGLWNIALTVYSSNGQTLSIREDYSYKTSYYGETACNQTAQALMPAVQNLIQKLVSNPQFSKLVQ